MWKQIEFVAINNLTENWDTLSLTNLETLKPYYEKYSSHKFYEKETRKFIFFPYFKMQHKNESK